MRALIGFALFAVCGCAAPLVAQERTVSIDVKGRRLEGMPLHVSEQQIALLSRDGQLLTFAPTDATNYTKPVAGFRGYTSSEMRGLLAREFGGSFEVSGTGHFMVVHPVGQKDKWAARFEEVYRSFIHYFQTRGLRLSEPKFTLVAVVFPTRTDFQRYCATHQLPVDPNILGYYQSTSNRILMFDVTAGRASNVPWQVNAETIIHETAHQVAFNTGVHARFTPTPRWVAEGLGTLFEAPGVWNTFQYRSQADRVNRGRLAAFKQYSSRRKRGSLAEFISSDRLFDSDPNAAYAEAWALSFYLTETQPRQYAQYMSKLAKLPPFADYSGGQRLKDFSEVFGGNLALVESRMLGFLGDLK
jgi:hypothetical protein